MALHIDIREDALYQLGQQQGREEGLQKGLEKGLLAGKEEAALNMLRKGMSDSLVSEVTELPAERIAQLRQQLEAGQ